VKKVLVSVISCTLDHYPDFMKAQMDTWDLDPVQGVESFYYLGRPHGLGMNFTDPRMMCFDVDEAYNTMGRKDLMAYKHIIEHYNFDYMARVNSSCYVRKKLLLDYCQTLPDSGVFKGVKCPGPEGRIYAWGGAQYVFSRDVVQAFVDHEKSWNHGVIEDVSMSWLAEDVGITIDGTGRCGSVNRRENDWLFLCYNDPEIGGFEFTDFADMAKTKHQHFIRVKQDLQPDKTIWIMKELKRVGL